MNDSINRQDVVSEIDVWIQSATDNETDIAIKEFLSFLKERIDTLPSTDRPTGKWIEKPHKVYLPRDYEPDITDYRDCQYNEEDHSIIEQWWHCNQCDYEADRFMKPTFNFCPNCGARMDGGNDE